MTPPLLPISAQYSIDMFDVGLGDCIVVQLQDPLKGKITLYIDGGCKSASETLLPLFENYFRGLSAVISTHPDNDHIGGLPDLIKQVRPSQVFINNPLDHISRESLNSLTRHLDVDTRSRIQSAVDRTQDVVNAARSVKIVPLPITDSAHYTWGSWNIYFLNPDLNFYKWLWTTKEGIAELYTEKVVHESDYLRAQRLSVLDDGTETTNMNNTSAVTYIEGHGKKFLFTGDAGMRALRSAMKLRPSLQRIDFLDGPHHGSRRNVDTAIIKQLAPKLTYISASDNDEHPCDEVVATLQYHGSDVYTTKEHGSIMWHSAGMQPNRPNYGPISPLSRMDHVAIIRDRD